VSNRPPIVRGEVFDTAVLANTDVFAADITPARPSAFRITVSIKAGAADSILNVQLNDGSSSVGPDLNAGTALGNGTLSTFAFGTHPGVAVNFQFETGTTIGYLLVEEIQAGGL